MVNENQMIENFLKKYDMTVTISNDGEVQGFPNDSADKYPHKKYKVTISRHGNTATFSFYGSYADYQKGGVKPSKLDVLESFFSDATYRESEDIKNPGYFIKVSGMEYDDAVKVFNALKRQEQKARKLFPNNDELYNAYNEILEIENNL